jgi:hypothetical protein
MGYRREIVDCRSISSLASQKFRLQLPAEADIGNTNAPRSTSVSTGAGFSDVGVRR